MTHILDADTVDVLGPNGAAGIRLTGTDAREWHTFMSESRKNLGGLNSGKSVNLDCENQKSYGRLSCKILLPNGEDMDLDQNKAGIAWGCMQYQDGQSPAESSSLCPLPSALP